MIITDGEFALLRRSNIQVNSVVRQANTRIERANGIIATKDAEIARLRDELEAERARRQRYQVKLTRAGLLE
jgi:hypothetical protein